MNKIYPSAKAALDGIVRDGQLIAVGGFGLCGIPEPYCAGQTIQLNGTAGATYTWTGPGFNSNLQNPTIAGATTAMAGTYNFTVDFGGCQANGSTNVTVNALPTPTAANNGPLCEGATLMLAGSPAVTYTWTAPNSFGSPLQSPNTNNVTLAANGTYTFAVTDANNCSNSFTTNVVINSNPTPVVNNPSLCENQTISLTANGGSTYNWSGPGGFTSNLQNPTIPNATTAMSGVYTVTVTTAGGCVNTANANVAVTPAPTPSIVTNSPICINNILMLSATGGVSYQWTGPNGFFSSVQNPTVNANTTNYSGTYQVTVTDGNGVLLQQQQPHKSILIRFLLLHQDQTQVVRRCVFSLMLLVHQLLQMRTGI